MTSGHCLCGSVTFELAGDPLATAVCHCEHCQRQSGSAFSVNIIAHKSQLTLNGELLLRILSGNAGRKGLGGYLQLHGDLSEAAGAWSLRGKPIEPGQAYRIRTIEYLAQGNENGLEFLNPAAPGYLRSEPVMDADGKPLDVRQALIGHLRKQYGG